MKRLLPLLAALVFLTGVSVPSAAWGARAVAIGDGVRHGQVISMVESVPRREYWASLVSQRCDHSSVSVALTTADLVIQWQGPAHPMALRGTCDVRFPLGSVAVLYSFSVK